MTASAPSQKPRTPPVIERRIRKIANARSITLSLALTFLGLALVGAVAIRFLDENSFPTFGQALWWAVQTVTTVGYGDVVPSGGAGKVIGSIEMVLGVSFISFLTAGVTSAVVQRAQAKGKDEERERDRTETQTLVDALADIRKAIADLDQRLDQIG
jgi:voltage-gated potassium channel Kch